jgi:hypothetical protein
LLSSAGESLLAQRAAKAAQGTEHARRAVHSSSTPRRTGSVSGRCGRTLGKGA